MHKKYNKTSVVHKGQGLLSNSRGEERTKGYGGAPRGVHRSTKKEASDVDRRKKRREYRCPEGGLTMDGRKNPAPREQRRVAMGHRGGRERGSRGKDVRIN